jgi:3-oxoacyl-[acyl-carrier-protein] synthase III
MHRYLKEGLFQKGDKVMLWCFASGLVLGVVTFVMGDLVDRYGLQD